MESRNGKLRQALHFTPSQKRKGTMSLYDQLRAAAIQTGETVGATINGHLVACVPIDEGLGWIVNDVLVSPEFARDFVERVS